MERFVCFAKPLSWLLFWSPGSSRGKTVFVWIGCGTTHDAANETRALPPTRQWSEQPQHSAPGKEERFCIRTFNLVAHSSAKRPAVPACPGGKQEISISARQMCVEFLSQLGNFSHQQPEYSFFFLFQGPPGWSLMVTVCDSVVQVFE